MNRTHLKSLGTTVAVATMVLSAAAVTAGVTSAGAATVRAAVATATATGTAKATATATKTPTPTATATATITAKPTVKAAASASAQPLDSYGDLVAPVGGYFGPTSVWETPVTGAPLAADSAAQVNDLTSQVAAYYSGTAAFNVWQSNESLISAPAGTALSNVVFDDCQHKGYTPAGLFGPGGAFVNVPIPANAVPATGTDASMAIYSPSTDEVWSFWKANHQSDGWHACWGGVISGASTSPGYFPNGLGATATGLSSEGGAITIRDVESGSINHALSLEIPNAAPGSVFSWPAQRSDGQASSTGIISEGTHLRLDPSIDVSRLNLSPIGKMIAVAAQTYGFFVTDYAGGVSVETESGNAVANATGTNPWGALMGGKPSYTIMSNFPWAGMQALPASYGQPAATASPTPTATATAAPLPAVTGLSPTTGPAAGGTRVTVTGQNLTGVTSIFVGNYPATNVSCPSSTTCTLTTPAGTSWHNVIATTAAGSSNKIAADQFTYGS